MEIHPLIDPYAIHYDSYAGDVYTLDTAGITLTAGTLTAAAAVLTTADINSGNIDGTVIGTGTTADGHFTALTAQANAFQVTAGGGIIAAGGDFVIDPSGNITDCGTIASGNITITGPTAAGFLEIIGASGGIAKINISADAKEDNIDQWKWYCADGGAFYFQNKASGSFVSQLSLTPANPMSNAVAAFTGITRFGDGGAANYAQIAAAGTVTLHGNARFYGDSWIPANTVKGGGTSPAAWAVQGISGVFVFADGSEDEIIGNIQIPPNMDRSVAPTFLIGWSTNDTNENDCEWKLEYLYTAAGEDTTVAAQDTDTSTDTACAQADGLNVLTKTLDIVGASDMCMHFRLTRLAKAGSNDTIADSVEFHGACLRYTANKLGDDIT